MYIQNISDTMTTEEYLRKKEQEELDEYFDNLKPLKVEEKTKSLNEIIAEEVSKLFDLESNLGIAQELFLNSENKTTNEIKSLSAYIRTTKSQYTKQKNKLDKLVKELE